MSLRVKQTLNWLKSESERFILVIWNNQYRAEDFKKILNIFSDFKFDLILIYGKDLDKVAKEFTLFDLDICEYSHLFEEWNKHRKKLVGDRGQEIENKFVSRSLISIMYSLSKRNAVNRVFTNYYFTGGLLNIFNRRVKKILDLHDVFSRKSKLYYNWNKLDLFQASDVDVTPGMKESYVISHDLEAAFLNSADTLITISMTEYEIINKLLPHKLNIFLPYNETSGVTELTTRYTGLTDFSLIMSDNFANRKDLVYFLQYVWKYVDNPKCRLNIIGGITKFYDQLQFVNVVNCGTYVDDQNLRFILANTDALLFINRIGSGQRVKYKYFENLRIPSVFFTNDLDPELIENNMSLICGSRHELIDILNIGKVTI